MMSCSVKIELPGAVSDYKFTAIVNLNYMDEAHKEEQISSLRDRFVILEINPG